MDKRRQTRSRTLKSAKIAFNGHHSTIDCTIRNLSVDGACLQVPNALGIPEKFDVIFEGSTRPCRIIWRKPRQLGVEFA